MRIVRGLGWLALVAAAGVAMLALLPIEPSYLDLSLDGSFAATLHYAAATPGTHLISTYGPLGFLQYPTYLPATWGWLVAGQALLGAILCWTVAWIGWAAWASPWGGALALAASAPLLGNADVRWFVVPALALFIDLPVGRRAPLALRVALGVAIGAVGLIKVSYLIAAAAVLVPLAARELYLRRAPVLALVAAASTALLWRGSGRGVGEWMAFLDWSLRDIAPGYAQAMQLPTTPLLVGHAALVSAAVLVAALWLARRSVGAAWWVYGVALGGWLFLLFKAGFVRADVHHLAITALGLIFAAVLLALLSGPRRGHVALAALLVVLLPVALYRHIAAGEQHPGRLFTALGPGDLWRRAAVAPALLAGGTAAAADREARARLTRGQTHLPPLEGSVDFISYLQSVVLAHDLDLTPRPVFQSYMAYTPRLARANAAFFAGAAAPRWLILYLAAIDGRLPALDDAAARLELLARYQFSVRTDGFAILERRAVPRAWRLEPLDTVETTSGVAIPVPSMTDGPVWARIDVGETFGDRLGSALLSAPIIFLELSYANGVGARYRLVSAIARDGVLLSPLITSNNEFLGLMELGVAALGRREVARVTVRLQSPFSVPLGPRPVRVEFLRLVID